LGDAPVKTNEGSDATKPKEKESKGSSKKVVIVAITIGAVALVGAAAFLLVRRRMNGANTAV
jgi:LPXTG-motif cell wall-anchored protein